MFSTAQREEPASAASRPFDAGRFAAAIKRSIAIGVLFVDRENNVLQETSDAAASLLRCRNLGSTNFAALLKPLVAEKSLRALLETLARTRACAAGDGAGGAAELADVEVRLPNADGSTATAFYRFRFSVVDAHPDRSVCMLAIADETADVQHLRELKDLRSEVRLQSEILRSLLRIGGARFAASMQRADVAMNAINPILKKPAREQAAFRNKLEETLLQVDCIRREGAALKLTSLERTARSFEDSLHDLRSRATLSGGDFLPLAVELDALFGQFALVRTLTRNAQPPAADAAAAGGERMTDNGTQIIDAPELLARMTAADLAMGRASAAPARMPRAARSGSLEGTLASLTQHIAEEYAKVVQLECVGLDLVPAPYQGVVKNVAIQLIRNAIMHGIEAPEARALAGKAPCAALRLVFTALPVGGYELRFHDDGCGIDPQLARDVAVAKGLIDARAAAALADRQAIKVIFKTGFTTIENDRTQGHGGGLTLVRRYVEEAGGKIALASMPGRDTRFKVSLPALAPAGA